VEKRGLESASAIKNVQAIARAPPGSKGKIQRQELLAVVQCEQTLTCDASRMMRREEAARSFQRLVQLPARPRKGALPMPANEILQEAKKLRKVSESLDVLAERHAPISEALSILSGSVRNSATLLEVLVALKLTPAPGYDPRSN
jgi:hypothetical protein